MSHGAKGTGAEFLVRKSGVVKSGHGVAPPSDILIVEDMSMDADRLIATLRSMFGYGVELRRAKTLTSALDEMLKRIPDVIMLDDYLVTENAGESIPMLRRVPFQGPIIVVSGKLDRLRRAELIKKGANDAINKDDLNSVEIAEALARLGMGVARADEPPAKG